jgi:hypothetical protein
VAFGVSRRTLVRHRQQLGELGERSVALGESADHEPEGRAHVIDAGPLDRLPESVGNNARSSRDEDRQIGLAHLVPLGLLFAWSY